MDLQADPSKVAATFPIAPGGLRRRQGPPGWGDRRIHWVSLGQQDMELGRVKGQRGGILNGPPGEPSFGEPLGAQPKPVSVKYKDFKGIF